MPRRTCSAETATWIVSPLYCRSSVSSVSPGFSSKVQGLGGPSWTACRRKAVTSPERYTERKTYGNLSLDSQVHTEGSWSLSHAGVRVSALDSRLVWPCQTEPGCGSRI